jgi:uncharacterized protein involved in type VI secretion and phage assembly
MISTRTDDVLARLIERVDGRYYGKYRGVVTDNKDPDRLGRVRAKVPRLLGDEPTGWALPAFPYGGLPEQGFFAVPEVTAGVWIEFEGGDLSYPIWSGTWYATGAIPESATPDKKVLKTRSGHRLVLDDDGKTLTLADASGNRIAMDASGIEIRDANGHSIKLTASGVSVNDGALEVT